MASNTQRGYASDWARFTHWCDISGTTSLPATPATVAAYISAAAELVDGGKGHAYKPSTIARWLAAINHAHHLAGFAKPGAHPVVQTTMRGIKRELGAQPQRRRPLVLDELRTVLAAIERTSWPQGIVGRRDYALLLMGFAGAFRRSELVQLDARDVRQHPQDGLHVTLRRSKTDQEGEGLITALPFGTRPETCAPCAYALWCQQLSLSAAPRPERIASLLELPPGHVCHEPIPALDGALFRPVRHSRIAQARLSPAAVHDVVLRRARDAGLSWEQYGGHSLRAGFVTESFRAGRTHHEIMRQTHHRSYAMLEVYSRENNPLRHNAVTSLGL